MLLIAVVTLKILKPLFVADRMWPAGIPPVLSERRSGGVVQHDKSWLPAIELGLLHVVYELGR